MSNVIDRIQKQLFLSSDTTYKNFQCKLMPTVDPNTVIGVRTPIIRKMAKEYINDDNIEMFLHSMPHAYYEENNLHSFLTERINDFDICIREIERFLPFVDNWATCDGMRPKCFSKNKERLLPYVKDWVKSKHTYTVRYGIGMLMVHFLDNDFLPEYLETVTEVRSDEYYVNMMRAWYFATALAKQYEYTLPYIQKRRLDKFTHEKTVQKAVESYRITAEQKEYLKSIK